MLYPLSITSAKPRELKIYVNITPNNDMFNVKSDSGPAATAATVSSWPSLTGGTAVVNDVDKINIFYFDEFFLFGP